MDFNVDIVRISAAEFEKKKKKSRTAEKERWKGND